MKKLIVLAALIMSASTALAYDGWSTGVITKVRFQQGATLVTQPGADNPGECADTSYRVLNDNKDDFTRRANSALLAAKIAGGTVSLAVSGCSGAGTAGFPVISEVWLND